MSRWLRSTGVVRRESPVPRRNLLQDRARSGDEVAPHEDRPHPHARAQRHRPGQRHFVSLAVDVGGDGRRRVPGVPQEPHQPLGVGGDRGRGVGGARTQRQAAEQEPRVVGEGGAVGAAQILGRQDQARTLVDGEPDVERAGLARGGLGGGGGRAERADGGRRGGGVDARLGLDEAAGVIVLEQALDVLFELLAGGVAARPDPPKWVGPHRDDLGQLLRREQPRAGELDPVHLEHRPLVDREHDPLLLVRQPLPPPLDPGEEVPLLLVAALDGVGAGADLVVVVGPAGEQGQLVLQRRRRLAGVPLEGDGDPLALVDGDADPDVLGGPIDALLDAEVGGHANTGEPQRAVALGDRVHVLAQLLLGEGDRRVPEGDPVAVPEHRIELVGGDGVVAGEGDGPERIGRAEANRDVEIERARGAPRPGVETDVCLEVAPAAQEVDDQLPLALQHGDPLGAGGRQRLAGADGDAALDLVLLDAAVAADEHVAQAFIGEQRRHEEHAARRRAGAEDGAVTDGIQRLHEPRDRPEGTPDPIARARLDEGVAEGGDREHQGAELVIGVDARAAQLVADDRDARGRGGAARRRVRLGGGGGRRRRCHRGRGRGRRRRGDGGRGPLRRWGLGADGWRRYRQRKHDRRERDRTSLHLGFIAVLSRSRAAIRGCS